MGICVILCAWMALFSRSVHGAHDSHNVSGAPEPAAIPGEAVAEAVASLPFWANVLAVSIAIFAPIVLFVLWRRDVIRPGSLARRGLRDVSAWPWWYWLLCAFSVWLTMGIGAGIGMATVKVLYPDAPQLVETAAMTSAGSLAGIAAAVVLFIITRSSVKNPRTAGLILRPDRSSVLLGLLAIALAFPVVQATSILSVFIFNWVMGAPPDVIAHDLLDMVQQQPGHPASWFLVAGAVIGAPIVEEIVFRVFLQSALLRLFGRAGPAILIASVIFALAHLGAGVSLDRWHTLPVLFVLGAAMGVAYEWTRRPVVPIVMHMVFNGFNVTLVIFGVS